MAIFESDLTSNLVSYQNITILNGTIGSDREAEYLCQLYLSLMRSSYSKIDENLIKNSRKERSDFYSHMSGE